LSFLNRWSPTRHLAAAAAIGMRIVRSKAAVHITALSIAIHLFTVAAAWCAAKAVNAPLAPTAALFLVLPVILITIVPISIAGWGVRESAMIVAFAYAGLPDTDGLLVSLLFGAATFLLGAIGGLVWIFGSDRGHTSALAPPEARSSL
jgi:glycosyltransferase 2 family protein